MKKKWREKLCIENIHKLDEYRTLNIQLFTVRCYFVDWPIAVDNRQVVLLHYIQWLYSHGCFWLLDCILRSKNSMKTVYPLFERWQSSFSFRSDNKPTVRSRSNKIVWKDFSILFIVAFGAQHKWLLFWNNKKWRDNVLSFIRLNESHLWCECVYCLLCQITETIQCFDRLNWCEWLLNSILFQLNFFTDRNRSICRVEKKNNQH